MCPAEGGPAALESPAGCQGLGRVLQPALRTREQQKAWKGLLADRETGQTAQPSLMWFFFGVVLTFPAWLVNLLKANFQQGAQSTPVRVTGSFELPSGRLGTSF